MNSTSNDLTIVSKHCVLGSIDVSLESYINPIDIDVWIKVDNKVYELGKHIDNKFINDLMLKLKAINGFDPKKFKLFDAWCLSIKSTKLQYETLFEVLNISRRVDIAILIDFPEDDPVPFVIFNLFVGECRHDFVYNKEQNTTDHNISLILYADNTSHIRQYRQSKHTKANENKRLNDMICRLADTQDEYFGSQNSRKPPKVQLKPKMLQLKNDNQESSS